MVGKSHGGSFRMIKSSSLLVVSAAFVVVCSEKAAGSRAAKGLAAGGVFGVDSPENDPIGVAADAETPRLQWKPALSTTSAGQTKHGGSLTPKKLLPTIVPVRHRQRQRRTGLQLAVSRNATR